MQQPGRRPLRSVLPALLAVLIPCLLLLGLHLLSQHYSPVAPPEVQQLAQARSFEAGHWAPTQDTPADALSQSLPLRRPAWQPAVWYVLDFELAQPASESWMLMLQHRPGLSLYLDGALLAHSLHGVEVESSYRGRNFGTSTLLVNVPPTMLNAGTHHIGLLLESTAHEPGALSTVKLGPAPQLRELMQSRAAWQNARLITALAALLIGAFLVLVWLALRQEWVYGLTGVYVMLLALLLMPYLNITPWLPMPWWRMLLDAADVLAKGLPLYLAAQMLPVGRPWHRWLALGFIALALPLDLYAAFKDQLWDQFDSVWPWWALGSRLTVLLCTYWLGLKMVWRSARFIDLAAASALGLALLCWSYVSYEALIAHRAPQVVDINVAAYAGLVALAGSALQRRFVRTLRAQARSREALEQALAERSAELQARYEELQRSEQLRTAALERERLLQEVHDGLGSQLLMTRLGVRQGMDHEALGTMLDECISELRLTVDAMTVQDGDLGLLLANVRHRLQDKLRAAGLQLEWQLQDAPRLPRLAGAQGRDLVRIVQEALSNVLHHAQARRVRFSTRLVDEGSAVLLSVADDGVGLPEALREGQGLRSMRKRAERIGAQISWGPREADSERPGCELLLRIPVTPR